MSFENDQERMRHCITRFEVDIITFKQSNQIWAALQNLFADIVGYKLFTVMTVDMKKLEAARVFTSHPVDYPVSGTKPIHMDMWFDVVHRQQKLFVANTIKDIAKVFPDYEKIWALGCGSVVNVPVVIKGALVATINILHAENYYTADRIAIIEKNLRESSRHAYETIYHAI